MSQSSSIEMQSVASVLLKGTGAFLWLRGGVMVVAETRRGAVLPVCGAE